jgi:Protein of unknown function (DUF3800)
MRLLYLDDSGKVHANDPAKFVVFGGFSVDEGRWHHVVRQVAGAKAGFFGAKGKPTDWEIKSIDFLTSNAWKRGNKRGLCFEIVNILKRNGCHIYVASLEKSKAIELLDESKFVPLLFQRLVAKFESEVANEANTGSIVCDWSTYKLDHHISNCTTSLVIANKLNLLRGGVTYGSSSSLLPLQVADLIAGAFQRHLGGQAHLLDFVGALEKLRYTNPGVTDFQGYPIDSILRLF